VISPAAFFHASRPAIVCPITSRVRPFASSVVLPPGLPIGGEVLASHVGSIDIEARPVAPVGARVPAHVLREKLALLSGIEG